MKRHTLVAPANAILTTPDELSRALSPAMLRGLRVVALASPNPTGRPRSIKHGTMAALDRLGLVSAEWVEMKTWQGWLFVLTDLGDRVWMSLPAGVRHG